MTKIRLLFTFLLFISGIGWGQNDTKLQKILADVVAVDNALSNLEYTNPTHTLVIYREKIKNQFTYIESLKTGFRADFYPFTLKITPENKKNVEKSIAELSQLLTQLRMVTAKRAFTFLADQKSILVTLLSENSGDYYSAVNPSFKYQLYNHPLRGQMEFIGLQDMGFIEASVASDTSLWNLTTYCPNLNNICLFGADINDSILSKLQLNKAYLLTVLDLSENQIKVLPATFNENNTLEYLSLSDNNISTLPSELQKWNQLRYLDLRNNPIELKEKERIKELLPRVMIKF